MGKKKKALKLRHPSDRRAAAAGPAVARTRSGAGRPPYNPEQWPESMNQLAESTISDYDFRKRMTVPAKLLKEGKVRISGRVAILKRYVDGRMVEASKVGKSGWTLGLLDTQESEHTVEAKGVRTIVEMRRFSNAAEFKEITESVEWATSKIIESSSLDGFDFGNDQGISQAGLPNNEFIPLLGGPFSKQLYLTDYLDMQAKCFWMKNHHPLGKAIVATLRNYVIGKGVKLMFKNPDCQDAWDAFEKRVDFHHLLRSDIETTIWGGEIMTEKTTTADGRPSLKQIDPSTVWEIVTDPDDINIVHYYHQQYPTQWQMIYKANDKTTEYIINDIPAEKIIHVKINVTPGEKRGRSDLFPVLSWLKRFRDWFNAKVTKAQMEESYALDVEVDGDQADVDRVAGDNDNTKVPAAGSTRVHNKEVQYKFLQPTVSSSQGRDDVGMQLINVIAIGAGMAADWLGGNLGSSGSTRASALVKENPATRNVEDKQKSIEGYVCTIGEYVIETDVAGGVIPAEQVRAASLGKLKQALLKRKWKMLIAEAAALMSFSDVTEPTDKTFEVIFPEISAEDRTAKIVDIMKGEVARYISHERAATMFAQEMAITSFDYDEEQEAIDAEASVGGGGTEWQQAATANQDASGAGVQGAALPAAAGGGAGSAQAGQGAAAAGAGQQQPPKAGSKANLAAYKRKLRRK